jgi:hypothetical protein
MLHIYIHTSNKWYDTSPLRRAEAQNLDSPHLYQSTVGTEDKKSIRLTYIEYRQT